MPDRDAAARGSAATRVKVRDFIHRRFPLARERGLADDASLLVDGVVDSLGVLDIVGFLEAEFGIAVADEELDPANFDSVDALVRFVETKRG
jgi:acyl carrier protein